MYNLCARISNCSDSRLQRAAILCDIDNLSGLRARRRQQLPHSREGLRVARALPNARGACRPAAHGLRLSCYCIPLLLLHYYLLHYY